MKKFLFENKKAFLIEGLVLFFMFMMISKENYYEKIFEIICIFGIGMVLFSWLRIFWGFDIKWALLGGLAYFFTWSLVPVYFYQTSIVMPFSMMLFLLGVIYITRENDKVLFLVLLFGVLCNGVVLILLPVRLIWRVYPWIWDRIKKESWEVFKLAIIPVLIFIVFRSLLPLEWNNLYLGNKESLVLNDNMEFYRHTLGIWGILGPLALLSGMDWSKDFRMSKLAWLVLFLYFVGSFSEVPDMIFVFAFPVIIPMALGNFSGIEQGEFHWLWYVIILSFLVVFSMEPIYLVDWKVFSLEFIGAIGIWVMEKMMNKGLILSKR